MLPGQQKDTPPAQPQQDSTGHSPETGGIMVGSEEHTTPIAPMEHEENEDIGTD